MKRAGLWKVTALIAAMLLVVVGVGPVRAADPDDIETVQEAIETLNKLTNIPADAIPQWILERAQGIIVIPSLMKGGFIVGGQHGKGIMSVRDSGRNAWSAPAFIKMTGGSFGAQIGLESVELVLVVMNQEGVRELLQDKVTLGGSLSVSAGPVGRTAKAATDAQFDAKILAYSRSKGLFAGATLEGTALQSDEEANQEFYGKHLGTRAIVLEHQADIMKAPHVAKEWQMTLARVTSANGAGY